VNDARGIALSLSAGRSLPQEAGRDPRPYRPFFRRYCSDCHLEGTAKGGLDLAALSTDLRDAEATLLKEWLEKHVG